MNTFKTAYLNIINESNEQSFDYALLSRMKSDCEYFLGNGDGHEKHLWSGNVDDQIAKMKELWEGLTVKPEWLSMEDILEYERKMKAFNSEGIFDKIERKFPKVCIGNDLCFFDITKTELLARIEDAIAKGTVQVEDPVNVFIQGNETPDFCFKVVVNSKGQAKLAACNC
jgi:hypothetical protein